MSETEKFNKMGKNWWDKKGNMAALHMINPIRFEYFKKVIGDIKGKRVLDIGCGGGLLSEEFARKGASVTGVDLSPVAIEAAKKHAEESGLEIDYRNCALADIKEKDYDIVVCAEMLEHVNDISLMIAESAAKVKKGGLYLFETINKTPAAWFFAIFMAENVLNFVGRGTHAYEKFIRPSHLAKLLADNDITVKEVKGMTFSPLEWKFSISDSTSINYIGYGVKS